MPKPKKYYAIHTKFKEGQPLEGAPGIDNYHYAVGRAKGQALLDEVTEVKVLTFTHTRTTIIKQPE